MWQDQIAHAFDVKERTDDVLTAEKLTFDELLLSDDVLIGLKKSGFYRPSPIQLKAIPLGRCGLDLVVQAKSGTGKTCVFTVIALESISPTSSSLQVVILAPTREIALQIHGVVSCIGQNVVGLNAQVFIGGTQVSEDRIKAKKCNIAIGSPGRLKQLIELGVLHTSSVRMFVLDEADKLIEEGNFQQQINWIYSSMPVNKQMIALSATYPEILAQFLTRYMREPTFVRLDSSQPSLLGLRQYYIVVKECRLPHVLFEEKTTQVIRLLSNLTFQQALIFSNYHTRAESICEALNCSGWPSTFISGNMEQSRRTEAINKLKLFQCRVLISTDLTSRGIDAQNVDLVINMDVPCDWETYMHRIGRAGRFGSRGIAVSLVSAGDEELKLYNLMARCNADIQAMPDNLKEFEYCGSEKLSDRQSKQSLVKDLPSNDILQQNVFPEPTFKPHAQINGDQSVSKFPKEVVSQFGDKLHDKKVYNSTSNDTLFDEPKHQVMSKTSHNGKLPQKTVANQTVTPSIPSLMELQATADNFRENTHYLCMTYEQMKADYDHYVLTSKFAEPPPSMSDHANDELSKSVTKLNIQPESSNVTLSAESPTRQKDYCVVECTSTSSSVPIASSVITDNKESVSYSSETAGNVDAALLKSSSSHSDIIPSSPICTHKQIIDNDEQTPNNASEMLKSGGYNEVSKSTVKNIKKESTMKAVRQRHPMCAAAGIDILKHWTLIEKTNSLVSSTPTKSKASSPPNTTSKTPSKHDNLRPVSYSVNNTAGASLSLLKQRLDKKTYYDNDSSCDEESACESDEIDSCTTSDDATDVSSSTEDSSVENYCYPGNWQPVHKDKYNHSPPNVPFIKAPPPLYHFGSTGHCFSPYLCTQHSTSTCEAFFSHQVYHYALQHARKQVETHFSCSN